ncbi:hydroxyacylglutathione hydrolase [Hydrogenophilus thiooxidans]|uniref:hydroxyacylglutathione hydrolase n=1 Tax=Hydrogenophilus thiooxidans TaxID=2820326 RepID=UPI001C244281|nr:hydroxyacylglutathione hydrolase [Hydrogenophilus thiooxidans]
MTHELQRVPIPAFADNYVWIVHDGGCALAVDPGDAQPVRRWLAEQNVTLKAILITHHHADHTGGVVELAEETGATIFGPANEPLPRCDMPLQGGEVIESPGDVPITLNVIAVPGHTRGHIAYYGNGWLFCGDTLFSAGCGRLFEGSAEQLFASLERLKVLPDATEVCCAHEYTLKNLAFAEWVEPDNNAIRDYRAWCESRRAANAPTLPSTIEREKAVNPFFRVDSPTIGNRLAEHFGTTPQTPIERFRLLRAWRDRF